MHFVPTFYSFLPLSTVKVTQALILIILHRSLGVLLYTLVYGAMPFDGSNFKRLVKQITTGDYYEPRQPSCKSSSHIPSYTSSVRIFFCNVKALTYEIKENIFPNGGRKCTTYLGNLTIYIFLNTVFRRG